MRRLLSVCTLGVLLIAAPAAAGSEIAVTFDDLPVTTAPRAPIERQQKLTRKLVGELERQEIPAIGFVNANKLEVEGEIDPDRLALLEQWIDAGLDLGNHTFSHADLHRISLEEWLRDAERGERPVRELLARHEKKLEFFRHPFLHTGRSEEIRSAVTSALASRGVRIAPVTIDNSEWIYARAYDEAIRAGDSKLRKSLADSYVNYMLDKVAYYDSESQKLFGRKIRQVLLVHANALNADHFGRLARELRKRGHRLITLERALQDPAYATQDRYLGPAGISWLDRWALTRGVPKGFFADEPRTPQWVLHAAGVDSE